MVAKKTAAKKTTAKKPVKKVVRKKSVSKKAAPMQSFRVYKPDRDFVTFKITRQTVYWAILLIFVIVTQLWLLKLQIDIADLTNSLIEQ